VSIVFPLSDVNTKFGTIPTPLLTISVLTKFGYQSYQFLFDTGADFTMLPRYMAEDIGVNTKTLPQIRSYGIEGRGINVFIGKIKVKFASEELTVRCLFSEKDTTPFLLGRIDIFTHFNIAFDNIHKKVTFTPI
jgi:predicted aspartyl protease